MGSAQRVKQLLIDIQEDRKRYITLEKLLIKQRELMVGHQTEALEALNPQLTELYNMIDKTATERRLLMQQLQLPANKEGIHQLLSRLPPNYREHAGALWADLRLRANACHQQNHHNGMLLTQQITLLSSLVEQPTEFLYAG
ncbi:MULTISPECIES: flagellar export chaperone FlgN [Yersinia pseudotuberculosis complex]|uniref:Flagellar biosynthesis protein FlgN n=1 Tax=Yersinia similis TaxID=367190 RepID=A0A0T9RCE2_9GAMM|nr:MULTISPECIES: flagellar export chaperone FlgN [Yersinia pseudotuberculosis complex]AHK18578.1 flagellar biosynthesis protein FlgN [Yersinia similis]AJK18361.1 flgN family protein [Yersinia pseudotuberculosis str. PA3606]CFQ70233.1 flagellar protein FlgN [Yersinia similis]CNC28856.1 flagellar protein FlgN [Yersinia similis]CNF54705.1 flagellar protein FlgN [Yersinia similis]